ncbi:MULTISPECIES: hypothetical protein [unclassified Bradyrhizobium]|nr:MULTISPECIES: hypothetical protein [unclassified Bradyrhizobium]
MTWLKRLLCLFIDHRREADDEGAYGSYGWKCPRCGETGFGIHDM